MYPFRSYFCIWHLPRLQFNRLNMHAKVHFLFWNEGRKRKKVIFKKKKWFYLSGTADEWNKNSRLAVGRTVGCLSQTANENRFARFLNNRNITPFTADIRKEEKLILLFTQSLGMPLYKGDSSYRVKSEEFWAIPLPHILCSEPTCHWRQGFAEVSGRRWKRTRERTEQNGEDARTWGTCRNG